MISLPALTSDPATSRRRYSVLVLTERTVEAGVGDWLEQQLPDGGLMVEQDLQALRGKSCLTRLAFRLAAAVRCSGRILFLRNAHRLTGRQLSRVASYMRTGRLRANWSIITMELPENGVPGKYARKLERLFQPDCVVTIRADARGR